MRLMQKPLAIFTGIALFIWGVWLAMPWTVTIGDERLDLLIPNGWEELKLGIFLAVCALPSIFSDFIYTRKPLLYIMAKVMTFSLALYMTYQVAQIDWRDPSIAFFLALTMADGYALFVEFKDTPQEPEDIHPLEEGNDEFE